MAFGVPFCLFMCFYLASLFYLFIFGLNYCVLSLISIKFLGSDLVSSWGLVQKLLKSKPKLKNTKIDEDEKDDEKDDLKKLIWNLEERRKFEAKRKLREKTMQKHV